MNKILLLSLLIFSGSVFSANNQVQFIDGWIKQLPPVVPMRAGYLQIKNQSDQAREIVAMQSSAFEKVEMHESKMEDGMMKMIELKSIKIPARDKIELKPGSKHLMLISPVETLQIGDEVEVIATFEDDSSQSFLLKVKK